MPLILYLGLVTLSVIWGASFFFYKILLVAFSPFAIVFFRSLFGVLILLIIMLATKRSIFPGKKFLLPLFVVGIFNSVLPWSLIGYSETVISSSMASILNATTPIWTLLIGILIFNTRSNMKQWLGVILGFIGIFVLLDIDIKHLYIDNFYGFLGMIAATFFYGLSAQMSRRYFQNITSYQIALFTLITSTTITGFLTLTTSSFHWDYLISKPDILFSVIGLGSFGSGIAYLIFYYLIQKGSAEFASLVTYLIPITAIFWGMTILGEEIKPTMIIGLILILSGVYISSRSNKGTKVQKLAEKGVSN